MDLTLHTQCDPEKALKFDLIVQKTIFRAQDEDRKKQINTGFKQRKREFDIISSPYFLDSDYPDKGFFDNRNDIKLFDDILSINSKTYEPLTEATPLYEVPTINDNKKYNFKSDLSPSLTDTIYMTEPDLATRNFDSLLKCETSKSIGNPKMLTPKQYLEKIKTTAHNLRYALIKREKDIKKAITTAKKEELERVKSYVETYVESDTSVLYDKLILGVLKTNFLMGSLYG